MKIFKPDSVEIVAENLKLCAGKKYSVLNSMIEKDIPPTRVLSAAASRRPKPQKIPKTSWQDFSAGKEGIRNNFFSPNETFPREEIAKIRVQLSDFTFVLYCGRGRFGHVWLVKDLSERIIALKLIRKTDIRNLTTEKAGLTAYHSKIRNFEHLIQIYHIGQTQDFFYYTMEAAYSISDEVYIPVTLDKLLWNCTFSPQDSADITTDILLGLQELHSCGLSHRDIKPDNIAIINNQIKITDVSLISGSGRKSFSGTEFFMPPDIKNIPDDRSGNDCDLFATGKILYLLLANEGNVCKFPQMNLWILCSKLARNLNRIINKACHPEYTSRYPDAGEFIRELNRAESASRKFFGRF